ncbi:MAG: glutathione S-transferase [Polyangiales bacterium]|jgi:glutathione S-transferase
MRTLWYISYSPWSRKARMALAHHQVEYERRPYKIPFDELMLRARLRQFGGKLTVPVLFDGENIVRDSYDIARHAEALGNGSPLFEDEPSCHRWNALSDEALAAARRGALERVLEDKEAQRENLRGLVPNRLVIPLTPVARLATRRMLKKYPGGGEARLVTILEELRAALAGGDTILDEFSYADIAMGLVVDFVKPVPLRSRGPATERIWAVPGLEARFGDLVQWRDRVLNRHGN